MKETVKAILFMAILTLFIMQFSTKVVASDNEQIVKIAEMGEGVSHLASDGTNFYCMKSNELIMYDKAENKVKSLGKTNLHKLFDKYEDTMVGAEVNFGDMFYGNDKLWSMLVLKYENGENKITERILVACDLTSNDKQFKRISGIPDEVGIGASYSIWNNKLFFVGGEINRKCTRNVLSFDIKGFDNWVQEPNLPSSYLTVQYADKREYLCNSGTGLLFVRISSNGSRKMEVFRFTQVYVVDSGTREQKWLNHKQLKAIWSEGMKVLGICYDGVILGSMNAENEKDWCYCTDYGRRFVKVDEVCPLRSKELEVLEIPNVKIGRQDLIYGLVRSTTENNKIFLVKYLGLGNNQIRRCTYTSPKILHYTGKALKPSGIKLRSGGVVLRKGIDYNLQYENNIEIGTAKVEIIGKGKFKNSSRTITFKIIPNDVEGLKLSTTKTNSLTLTWNKNKNVDGYMLAIYDEKSKTYKSLGETSKNSYTVKNLEEAKTYKFKVRAYKTVDGSKIYGDYSSELIAGTSQKKVEGLKLSTAKTNSLTITWNKNKNVEGYSVYMYDSASKKYKCLGNTSKNTYTVKNLKEAKTYKFKVRAYKTVNKSKKYGAYSSVLTTGTSTKTIKLLKLVPAKKSFLVTWENIPGATGYEVYLATSTNGKCIKKATTEKNIIKIKDLKAKSKYYVKIRTYKTVNGKKIYSAYSNYKTVKTK